MDAFDQLQQEYSHCHRCPALVNSRTQVVFGSGNKHAKVLFIGEAPGASEDKAGIPFCGQSGKVLEQLLQSINLSRNDIFITNTLLCHPPSNRNPAPEEVANCSERLNRLIDIMRPKVIVTIGNFATQRLLGKTGITKIRGKVFPVELNGHSFQVVPVIHPANYLYNGRNPELLQQMKEDFQTIAGLIDTKRPQKALGEF
ncbi:uracil-DNA glycosylase [Candidatus Woesearchaeota archaeon]|nr:uracil-DNA glycosylase [Candidatus Woesearchaeota archaeon]